MDETYVPVVKAKPERGREIKSSKMPAEKMIESLKNVVGNPHQPTEEKEELYHEGYVDGQKYLVPDSNLEAMKDMINIKMRPRRSLRYKHQTSFEISDYAHFNKKIRDLLKKVGSFSKSSSESTQDSSSLARSSLPGSPESSDSTEIQMGSKEDEASKLSETDSNESKPSKEFPVPFPPISKPSMADSNKRNLLEESLISSGSKGSEPDFNRSEKSKTSSTTTESKPSVSDSAKRQTLKQSTTTEESTHSPSDSSKSKESKESSSLASMSSSSSNEEENIVGEEHITNLMPEKKEQQEHKTNLNQEERHDKYLGIPREQELINKMDELSLIGDEKEPVKTHDPSALPNTDKTSQLYQKPTELVRQPKLSSMQPQAYEPHESEKCHFRFLLSGHLRADDTPMFIIEEHKRKSSIFKKQKADFFKTKEGVDADLTISGKFYKHNILEEINNEPIAYDILPQKIKIDQTKSKVFINSFLCNFHCGKNELTIKGEFVKHGILDKLTPKLFFQLEPSVPEYINSKENYYPYGSDAPTTVLIYRPQYVNPFYYNNSKDVKKRNDKGSTAGNISAPTFKSKDSKRDLNNELVDRIVSDSKLNQLKEQNTMNKEIENSLTKNNLHSEKSQKENYIKTKVDPEKPLNKQLQNMKNKIMKNFYFKKELDKNLQKMTPASYESANLKQTTLEGPKLKTYYQADDKGEYFSTYLPE